MARESCLVRAQREMESGRLWRAKEILEGNISKGYSIPLYRAFGDLLFRMGAMPEAGKYLFLAGEVDPKYGEAIEIYLKRCDVHWRYLVGTFPKCARKERLDQYPEPVSVQLLSMGAPLVLRPPFGKPYPRPVVNEPAPARAIDAIGCGAAVAVLFPAVAALEVLVFKAAFPDLEWRPWWVWLGWGIMGGVCFYLKQRPRGEEL